jgi:hypothetical protein
VKGNQITLKKMFMIATATHGRGQVKEREEWAPSTGPHLTLEKMALWEERETMKIKKD